MSRFDVVWSNFAEIELDSIFIYYAENVSINLAQKIVSEIINDTIKLGENPEIGQVEPKVSNPNRVFRYIVYKNYKIIYLVDIEFKQVRIFDVFDARQNPIKLDRSK